MFAFYLESVGVFSQNVGVIGLLTIRYRASHKKIIIILPGKWLNTPEKGIVLIKGAYERKMFIPSLS